MLAAGPVNAFHANGRSPRLLRDDPVLFFDDGTRSGIAIEAPEDIARHSAIRTQRAVFVNHVEKREFNASCRLACHFGFPVIVLPRIERGIAIIEPPPARPNRPARSLDGQVNGKDGQNSNACVYIVVGHQINPPHKEGTNGIQAELPSRPGRATEGSTRTHRGKTKKKGGEGCAAQSRARGSRSPAGWEANNRAALRVTGSAKHSPSCAENVAGSAIAFSARQRPAFTRPVRARPQAPRRQTFDSDAIQRLNESDHDPVQQL